MTFRYKDEALPLLNTAKKLLVDLRPLTLKLEVLEDMFTLLFAMGSDVRSQQTLSQQETVGQQIKGRMIVNRSHLVWFRVNLRPSLL